MLARQAPGLDAAAVAAAAAGLDALLAGDADPPGDPWSDLAAFLPLRRHRSRHDCVRLPFAALRDALENAAGSSSS